MDECRKADIVPFFYHTTLDWHRPEFREDFDAYLEYLEKAELVSVLRMKANGDAILRKTFEVGGRKKGKRCLGSCIRVGLAKSVNKSVNRKK